MAINWNLLGEQPNVFAQLRAGQVEGQRMRDDRTRRNALASYRSDPEGAMNALIEGGMVEDAANLSRTDAALGKVRARTAAKPHLERGDYAGAGKAAAPHDLDFGRELAGFDDDQLDRTHKLGQRSAAIVMAASRLPDPEQRRAYIDQFANELTGLGYTPEQIAHYDVQDVTRMRADAARFMELGDLAGKVSVEKQGDYAVTYETNPVTGSRPVSKVEIPPTRAELLRAQEVEDNRQYRGERLELDRRGVEIREREAAENDVTSARVQGEVLDKVRRSGLGSLGPGELEVWDYMRTQRMSPFDAMMFGDEPAPSPTPRAKPSAAAPGGPVGTRANPHRPANREAAAKLPPGTWFIDPAGNLIEKR